MQKFSADRSLWKTPPCDCCFFVKPLESCRRQVVDGRVQQLHLTTAFCRTRLNVSWFVRDATGASAEARTVRRTERHALPEIWQRSRRVDVLPGGPDLTVLTNAAFLRLEDMVNRIYPDVQNQAPLSLFRAERLRRFGRYA